MFILPFPCVIYCVYTSFFFPQEYIECISRIKKLFSHTFLFHTTSFLFFVFADFIRFFRYLGFHFIRKKVQQNNHRLHRGLVYRFNYFFQSLKKNCSIFTLNAFPIKNPFGMLRDLGLHGSVWILELDAHCVFSCWLVDSLFKRNSKQRLVRYSVHVLQFLFVVI